MLTGFLVAAGLQFAAAPSQDEVRLAAVAYDESLDKLPEGCAAAVSDISDGVMMGKCGGVSVDEIGDAIRARQEYHRTYTALHTSGMPLSLLFGAAAGATAFWIGGKLGEKL
jgi:hypothetical protein